MKVRPAPKTRHFLPPCVIFILPFANYGSGSAAEKGNDHAVQMDRWASAAGHIKMRQHEAASLDASQQEPTFDAGGQAARSD
jgi:hypothetical protein